MDFGFAAVEAMAPERTAGFCAASCAFDCEIEGESRSATFEQSHGKATHACSCGVLLLSHFHAFAVLQHSHVSMHVTFARVKVACEVDLNRLKRMRRMRALKPALSTVREIFDTSHERV